MAYGSIKADKVITSAGEVDLTQTNQPATQSEDGLMSAADKTKIDGVAAGAEVNPTAVSELTNDASYITAAEAPVQVSDLPTAVSELTNDSNYITAAEAPVQTSDLSTKADLVGGKVPNNQLPSIAITEYLGETADEAAMLALSGEKGDWAIRTDTSSTWVITGSDPAQVGSWTELAHPSDQVSSVNGYQGAVVLNAADVGAASSSIDLQGVTDNGTTTTDGATFGGGVEVRNLEARRTGTNFDVFSGYQNSTELTSQINANGDVTFAGLGTFSGDLRVQDGGNFRVRTAGNAAQDAILLQNTGAASFTGGVNSGGYTGPFASLQVPVGQTEASYGVYTVRNIAGTPTAQIFGTGAATFEGVVTQKGATLKPSDSSGGLYVMSTDGTTPNATVLASGKATFAGRLEVRNPVSSGYTQGLVCDVDTDGSYLQIFTQDGNANNAFSVYNGTAPATTVASISSSGAGTFAGTVVAGAGTYTGAGTAISQSGNIYIQGTPTDVVNDVTAISVVNPTDYNSPNVTITHAGAATFASKGAFGSFVSTPEYFISNSATNGLAGLYAYNATGTLRTDSALIISNSNSSSNTTIDLKYDGSGVFKGGIDVTSSTYSFIGRQGDGASVFAVGSGGYVNIGVTSGSDSNIILDGTTGAATFTGDLSCANSTIRAVTSSGHGLLRILNSSFVDTAYIDGSTGGASFASRVNCGSNTVDDVAIKAENNTSSVATIYAQQFDDSGSVWSGRNKDNTETSKIGVVGNAKFGDSANQTVNLRPGMTGSADAFWLENSDSSRPFLVGANGDAALAGTVTAKNLVAQHTNNIFDVYQGLAVNGTITSSISGNGDAYFANNAEVGPYASGDALTDGIRMEGSGQIKVQRRAGDGNRSCFSAIEGVSTNANIFANGSASFSGTVSAQGSVLTSDAKFKTDIADATSQLDDVATLGGMLRNWNWTEEAPIQDKESRFIGLIAQEAEQICPGVVTTMETGDDSYKAIKSDVLMMKMLGAISELKAENDALRADVEALKAQ